MQSSFSGSGNEFGQMEKRRTNAHDMQPGAMTLLEIVKAKPFSPNLYG